MPARTARATLVAFLSFYALCLFVQTTGSYFTLLSVGDWYRGLAKSPLTPPGPVFGIAWTTLYFLMALAAARVWRVLGRVNARPLRWWLIQLLLGWVWTMVFFGLRDVQMGFLVIVLALLAVLVSVRLFLRTERTAGWLMLPLLLWVGFASYLNGAILVLN